LDLLGPLGRGFTLPDEGKSFLVAGGAGIAPLHFLANRMIENGMRPVVFWGEEADDEYGDLPCQLGEEMELHLACMDGSGDHEGSVVGMFEELNGGGIGGVYACGPRGMLAALAAVVGEEGLADLQVSMEERMACGVGACRGCVVPAVEPSGGYLTACKDGPVFFGRELDWRRI
jgi:dihydroorotate dehydrogenase electron transfer subunit